MRKAEAGTAWAGQVGMRAYSTDLKERLVRAAADVCPSEKPLAALRWRWPTLTVTSDGIIDRGSGLITGFGLIPWHEIEGVVGGIRPIRNALSELTILPVNFARLIARQSRLKRPLLRFGSAMRDGCIAI